MLTQTLLSQMTLTRVFSIPFSIDTNPSTPRHNVETSGLKRRNAGYGTGPDLAPGGAD